jgi:hypothetical protein
MHVGQLQGRYLSGARPAGDVQGVVQQRAEPGRARHGPDNKSLWGFAAFVPAIIVPITAQDVGAARVSSR